MAVPSLDSIKAMHLRLKACPFAFAIPEGSAGAAKWQPAQWLDMRCEKCQRKSAYDEMGYSWWEDWSIDTQCRYTHNNDSFRYPAGWWCAACVGGAHDWEKVLAESRRQYEFDQRLEKYNSWLQRGYTPEQLEGMGVRL